MKKFGIAALVLIAGFFIWEFFYPSGSWRYRLSLEVETLEGIVTGSAVREVRAARQPAITPESGSSRIGYVGEAVVVDLGTRGVLFALLNKDASVDYGYRIVFHLFPYEHGGTTELGISYYSHLRAKTEVPLSKLPTLVRFRDLNDPKTVELVDPADLGKSFGAGVRLKAASIELVDQGYYPLNVLGFGGEPVTAGIENKLPWLEKFYDQKLDGSRYHDMQNQNISNALSSGNFRNWRN